MITGLTNMERVYTVVKNPGFLGMCDILKKEVGSEVMADPPVNFVLSYIEMAMFSFNSLMRSKYVKNPAEPDHPATLTSITEVLQLFRSSVAGLVSSATNSAKITAFYAEFGFGAGKGVKPKLHPDLGVMTRKAAPDDSADTKKAKEDKKKEQAKAAKDRKKKLTDATTDTPPGKKIKKDNPGRTSSKRLCIDHVVHLCGQGPACDRGSDCIFTHPADKKSVDFSQFKKETENLTRKEGWAQKKDAVYAALG